MLRLLLLLGFLTGGAWLGLDAIEVRMVYPFDATQVSPADADVPRAHVAKFENGGETLLLWVANPKPGMVTILYFHGNAGNLANRAGRFNRFLDRGYGLIAPAYRGSSGSTGSPSEQRITSDVTHLYRNLDEFVPNLKPSATIVYGESLGTGVALKLVATTPDIAQPAGVILEAPYSSLPDVVRDSMPQLTPLLDQMTNIWNSAEHAESLRAPLLVMHGARDKLIPISQGKQVFDNAGSSHKTFVKVRGAGHETVWRNTTLPKMWKFIEAQSLSIR